MGRSRVAGDGGRFFRDLERRRILPQREVPLAEVGESEGKLGTVAVRFSGGQVPADGYGLAIGGQSLGMAASLGQRATEVHPRGAPIQPGTVWGSNQLPGAGNRFPDDRERPG